MSNPELSFLTDDAHESKGPDRDLSHRGRDVYVTIVSRDRDKAYWAIFFYSFDVEACIQGLTYLDL